MTEAWQPRRGDPARGEELRRPVQPDHADAIVRLRALFQLLGEANLVAAPLGEAEVERFEREGGRLRPVLKDEATRGAAVPRFEVYLFRRQQDYLKHAGERFKNTGGVFMR